MPDTRNQIAEVGDFDAIPFTDEQRRRASLVACSHALDADDARELMGALGLLPGQREEELMALRLGHDKPDWLL